MPNQKSDILTVTLNPALDIATSVAAKRNARGSLATVSRAKCSISSQVGAM